MAMIPKEREVLLAAHQKFLLDGEAELIDLLNLVEKTIPDQKSQERKDWTNHMGALCDVWQRRTEGEMIDWPVVCLILGAASLPCSDSN